MCRYDDAAACQVSDEPDGRRPLGVCAEAEFLCAGTAGPARLTATLDSRQRHAPVNTQKSRIKSVNLYLSVNFYDDGLKYRGRLRGYKASEALIKCDLLF